MLKDDIRRAVAIAMAEKGYRRSWYGWQRCELFHWTMTGTGSALGRFPSGMSRKRLNEALAGIPHIGPSIPSPIFEKADRWRQVDLETAIGESRR